jgi:hypothetical protein
MSRFRVLLASVAFLATSPTVADEVGLVHVPTDAEPLAARCATECDELEKQLLAATPVVTSGAGIFGSTGSQLDLETAGFAALAFHAAGRPAPAAACIERIAAGVTGMALTQTAAVALRAYGRMMPFSTRALTHVDVSFAPGGSEQLVGQPTLSRPLLVERLVGLGPGDEASIALKTRSDLPCFWDVGCSYRLASPRRARRPCTASRAT